MTREEAIKIIERVDICANAAETARDMAIEALKEPEVVHGYWIGRQLDNFRKYEVKCSECGWTGIENYDSYVDPSDFNFCPNCGAKMDGDSPCNVNITMCANYGERKDNERNAD